jgi:hypothetical protein
MQISDEGRIGIGLGLLALGGGGAIMVAPEQLWIGWGMIGVAAVGAAALLAHHFQKAIRGIPVLVLVGTGLIIAGGAIGLVGAVRIDASANKLQSSNRFFRFEKNVYTETKSIKWEDGKESEFYETRFYLVVGNAQDSGRTLKRAQARIFNHGEPSIAGIKETGSSEIDIRHGELALFEIGRLVSPSMMGNFNGSVILDSDSRKIYETNIPLGDTSFEVYSATGKRLYGLHHSAEQPMVWPLLMVVSADDAMALEVRVSIDVAKKPPVRVE